MAGINTVCVVEDRSIRLEVVVVSLVVAERSFGEDTEMIRQDIFDARAGIHPALFSRRKKSDRGGGIFGRPNGTAANCNVHCLRTRCVGCDDKRACECERREPSQSCPPKSVIGISVKAGRTDA